MISGLPSIEHNSPVGEFPPLGLNLLFKGFSGVSIEFCLESLRANAFLETFSANLISLFLMPITSANSPKRSEASSKLLAFRSSTF